MRLLTIHEPSQPSYHEIDRLRMHFRSRMPVAQGSGRKVWVEEVYKFTLLKQRRLVLRKM